MSRSFSTMFLLARRRPGVVALIGLLTTGLTPFVFFPEIMGDVGVTHAGAVRNGAAGAFLVMGVLLTALGLGLVARRRLKRRRG